MEDRKSKENHHLGLEVGISSSLQEDLNTFWVGPPQGFRQRQLVVQLRAKRQQGEGTVELNPGYFKFTPKDHTPPTGRFGSAFAASSAFKARLSPERAALHRS